MIEQELLLPDLRVVDDYLGAGGGGAGEGHNQRMLGIGEKLSGGLPGGVKQLIWINLVLVSEGSRRRKLELF